MFDFVTAHGDTLRDLAALGFVLWLTWLVARHGVTWVWGKASSIWSSIKADTSGLVTRVESLEANVAMLHQTTGVPTVAPVPAKAKAVAVAAKLPAAAVVPVVATGPTGS